MYLLIVKKTSSFILESYLNFCTVFNHFTRIKIMYYISLISCFSMMILNIQFNYHLNDTGMVPNFGVQANVTSFNSHEIITKASQVECHMHFEHSNPKDLEQNLFHVLVFCKRSLVNKYLTIAVFCLFQSSKRYHSNK